MIEIGSAGTGPGDGNPPLRAAYEAALHRLEDVARLRQALAGESARDRTGALRAVAGLHRAAVRAAVGPPSGRAAGNPQAGAAAGRNQVTPAVEADLLVVLAGTVGLRPDDLPALAVSTRPR